MNAKEVIVWVAVSVAAAVVACSLIFAVYDAEVREDRYCRDVQIAIAESGEPVPAVPALCDRP